MINNLIDNKRKSIKICCILGFAVCVVSVFFFFYTSPSKGIPNNQIIREEKATSTFENFTFSKDILRQRFPHEYSIVFITNNFHVYRAESIAKTVDISVNHLGADTVWYTIPMNYLRESEILLIFPRKSRAVCGFAPKNFICNFFNFIIC